MSLSISTTPLVAGLVSRFPQSLSVKPLRPSGKPYPPRPLRSPRHPLPCHRSTYPSLGERLLAWSTTTPTCEEVAMSRKMIVAIGVLGVLAFAVGAIALADDSGTRASRR